MERTVMAKRVRTVPKIDKSKSIQINDRLMYNPNFMHERRERRREAGKVIAEKLAQEFTEKRIRENRTVVYDPTTMLKIIFNMALLAATEEEIANTLGISLPTFQVWKKNYPEVSIVLREGKERADAKIANSLFHAGLGYSHEDEVILTNRVKEFDEFGRVIKEYTEPLRVKTVKHYPPNVKAAIKWLTSRRGEVWSDKAFTLNQNILNVNTVQLTDFTDEELALMQKLGVSDRVLMQNNEPTVEYIDDGTDENIN